MARFLNRVLLLIISVGIVFLTVVGSLSAQSEDKPNVLLIYTCQHSGEAISCAGAEHLETPALDRLAAEGVLFKNAYTPQPLCQPARVSMMTGRTPHTLGMTRNGKVSEIDAQYQIGKVLSEQGYDTAMMGKIHMVPTPTPVWT